MEPSNRQPPSFDSAPPERLSERGYRLRARIGGGRLGAIYEAQDDLSRSSGSQHFVAILLVDEAIAARPGFADEFERGAAQLKSIAHPNIVKLLEFGRDRNRYYLVNELLESASLRFVLDDVGALPETETTAVLRAVGDALQYLHAKGIVHGNLRPENVLVTFGYEVKLLDVVPADWLANPTDALGVPARAPDKRDDVFGLACLAYEMLAGRHPYNGNTAQEAYRAGLEPAPIEGLDGRRWRALSGALAVHRDDRTPNVAQFLDDFGVGGGERLKTIVAAASEPPPAQPAHAHAPVMPPRVVAERAVPTEPRRHGIAGRLLLLLAVIGIAAAAWFYQQPLGEFAIGLLAEIESRMEADSATGDRATAPVTASSPADETLPSSPTVTDPAPVTVLAPGAAPPAAVEPEPPPLPAAQEAPEAAAPVAAPPARAEAPGPTYFAFAQPAATVREGDVAARIVIRRSGDLSGAASVSWWTSDGTALAEADYADLGARVERFAPGESSRTVYVPLTNDAVPEPTKRFSVHLGRGENARSGGSAGEMRVDIVDDD